MPGPTDNPSRRRDGTRLVVLWNHLGPYHLARLSALHTAMNGSGLVAVEVFRNSPVYAWRHDRDKVDYPCLTLFDTDPTDPPSSGQIRRRVTHCLDRTDPAAVAVPGWSATMARTALLWCRQHRRQAILMSDSKADDTPRRRITEWVKRQVVSQFDAALVSGSAARDYASHLGLPPDRIVTGYDVVDNRHFVRGAAMPPAGLPDGYILACCRFIERKNLPRLVRAWAACRTRMKTACPPLVLAGDGPGRPALQQLITELDLHDVHLPGFVHYRDLPALYAHATCLVHPALQEQWGLVVNEAMAAGLPVLCSRTVGARYDLVIENRNGLLFDPTTVDEIADTLCRFVSMDDRQKQAMGSASSALIEPWSTDLFARNLLSAIDTGRRPESLRRRAGRLLIALSTRLEP